MKIVFMGTPSFAVKSLSALYESGENVMAVFTQPDKPQGRHMKLTPPPVKELAISHQTKVYQPQSLKKEPQWAEIIKNLKPDVIIVVAYGKILPKEILDIPKYGCINVHGSVLPKYRGAAPIQWSVINGDEEAGVTTMLMGEGLDTGDMLLVSKTPVSDDETASELYERLADVGAKLLIDTLKALKEHSLKPQKQDDSLATYAPMLSKEMCKIDFSKPVREVHKKIMGLSEWPCASATLDGKRIKIYRSEIVSEGKPEGFAQCGEITNEKDFTVACADGELRFLEIQAEGSKRMKTGDYLRGKPVKKGTVLI